MRSILCAGLAASLAALAAAPEMAAATFPGADGRIAFIQTESRGVTAPYALFSAEPDGTEVVRLTEFRVGVSQPRWSADGERITFTVTTPRREHTWIYTMNADGSDQERVVRVGIGPIGDALSISPSFTPGGDRIVYSTRKAIRSIKVDGTKVRTLFRVRDEFFGRLCCVADPTVSPSGDRVAFARIAERSRDNGLWTIDMNGDKLRRIAKAGERKEVANPDFSPDGEQIYFERGGADLLMRLDGSRAKLIPGSSGLSQVSLAPSGEQIVAQDVTASSDNIETCGDIFTQALTGGDRLQVTANCNGPVGVSSAEPNWQPLPG